MARDNKTISDLSSRRVIGFACNQAFVFYLFYEGINQSIPLGSFALERADLLFILLFIAVGLAVMGRLDAAQRQTVFSRPLLFTYAILVAAGSLIPVLIPDLPALWIVLEGALLGVPIAYLLTAWGRTFGQEPADISVIEVFVGSLVGAFVCLAFSYVSDSVIALVALRILPIASVVNLDVPAEPERHIPAFDTKSQSNARMISRKVFAGTLLFGCAAGCVETFGTDPGQAALSSFGISMVVFGAFLIGGISLLMSDGFGKGASLNKSYRLAVFVMMTGVLFAGIPGVQESILPGSSMVMAGYWGLETVLISLFLVLAKITNSDTDLAFSRGFTALFFGELLGMVASNLVNALSPGEATPFVVVVAAGMLILLSYIFFFTERDFDSLSEIATETDIFELTCRNIVDAYGLSARETEILVYALHGRTASRIAEELVISKSTVDTHLRRIYAKTDVHSRQELLDLAERVRRELSNGRA